MTIEHKAPAVARAIQVLKLLGAASEPQGVNAIARGIGVVPSSCLHILRALAEEGLVQADPSSKQYSLGLGLLALTHDMLGRNHFARVAQPELAAIAREWGVTATAVELDQRDRMVVVAMAQAATILKIQVGLGSRFPAYISATGRCVAAHSGLTQVQLKQRFASLQWDTAPSFETWLAEIDAARRNGVATDTDEYIMGFTVVAAPVLDQQPIQRAISVVGVTKQLSGKTLTSVKREVRGAAQRVTEQLRTLG